MAERIWCEVCGIVTQPYVEEQCPHKDCYMADELPMLKPRPGELTVECPKCHQHVSETCCAYQDFDYYKDCYCWITRKDAAHSHI